MRIKRSIVALLLLLPAPSLGVLAGMVLWPDDAVGKVVFFASKVWILALPVFWRLVVEKERISWSRPVHGGFGVAAVMGLAISAFIVAVYMLVGRRLIDLEGIREMAISTGLGDRRVYLAGAAYWVLVNSVLEEFVWRWFVVEKFEDIWAWRVMPVRGWWAIGASAAAFTIHHVVAMQVYLLWGVTLAAAVGIFAAGAAWSWCYVRYRSIWPGWVSHAMVDVAVFCVGYVMIFEGGVGVR